MDFKLRFFARHLLPYGATFLLWLIAVMSAAHLVGSQNLPARTEDLIMKVLAIVLIPISFAICWYGIRWFFRYRLRESIAILQACIDRDAITVLEWDETFAQAGAIQPHIHGWMIYGIRKHLRSQCRLY